MSIYAPILDLLNQIDGDQSNYKQEVIKDYWICLVSRECSLVGRKEVLSGKAKFGILGDGKEVPQVAMARAFQHGDFRSGYYRDQTFMMALGLCSVQNYFAQLYADTDQDIFSRGRQMNAHFATPLIDNDGLFIDHRHRYNVSSDISSTGGQMARALGLALASKQYRNDPNLAADNIFSHNGNEVSFCTIGDASTSEGIFWETLNAAAVQQVPLAVSVWDDGFGISVPIELQTAKASISEALSGLEINGHETGILIFKSKAWDYAHLVNLYHDGIAYVRSTHTPALFHIQEVTQPQGHSTSGSHERYKTAERMQFEHDKDCIKVMADWMSQTNIINQDQIETLQALSKNYVKTERAKAWDIYRSRIESIRLDLILLLKNNGADQKLVSEIEENRNLDWHEMVAKVRRFQFKNSKESISNWIQSQLSVANKTYSTHLYSESGNSPLKVAQIAPLYSSDSVEMTGYQILNQFFEKTLSEDKRFLAFGEDLGQIGDVNQGFAGLQEKFGSLRVFDTGIREWSIIGQAIGLSMRGLKPMAEIQYLDYLVYAMSPLVDDLSTVRYRSAGQQMAPAIIRTRGHRLEGIWHSGSPIGMMIHALRGIHICVPRNMVQAVGMYKTLLKGDDPAIVIECLNGYRLKEKMPTNFDQFSIPLGHVEILKPGTDVTLISYGSSIRIAENACDILLGLGIDVELIDCQTLLPFDINHECAKSVQKTNKLLILDEDVPGGASSYLLQQVIETQGAFQYLDSPAITITAKAHRPPYGSDGDYFSKPNVEDVVERILELMREYNPLKY